MQSEKQEMKAKEVEKIKNSEADRNFLELKDQVDISTEYNKNMELSHFILSCRLFLKALVGHAQFQKLGDSAQFIVFFSFFSIIILYLKYEIKYYAYPIPIVWVCKCIIWTTEMIFQDNMASKEFKNVCLGLYTHTWPMKIDPASSFFLCMEGVVKNTCCTLYSLNNYPDDSHFDHCDFRIGEKNSQKLPFYIFFVHLLDQQLTNLCGEKNNIESSHFNICKPKISKNNSQKLLKIPKDSHHCKKNLLNCLQLTCSMLQPSCHPNSTSWLNHFWRKFGVTTEASWEFLQVNCRQLSKCFFYMKIRWLDFILLPQSIRVKIYSHPYTISTVATRFFFNLGRSVSLFSAFERIVSDYFMDLAEDLANILECVDFFLEVLTPGPINKHLMEGDMRLLNLFNSVA
ncbi:hypothetical protein VP01_1584g2 [Puccinia sorghi]|uniref:Uncharacterized protein n=1 Tax=Puccinia sorghi TaxID=27349 RepID=A0A0L6VHL6_9BASI|nr:hypothetical protein VP01_1584g2 [Puccinia sorghi]